MIRSIHHPAKLSLHRHHPYQQVSVSRQQRPKQAMTAGCASIFAGDDGDELDSGSSVSDPPGGWVPTCMAVQQPYASAAVGMGYTTTA